MRVPGCLCGNGVQPFGAECAGLYCSTFCERETCFSYLVRSQAGGCIAALLRRLMVEQQPRFTAGSSVFERNQKECENPVVPADLYAPESAQGYSCPWRPDFGANDLVCDDQSSPPPRNRRIKLIAAHVRDPHYQIKISSAAAAALQSQLGCLASGDYSRADLLPLLQPA
jgi:hypothetical protein